MNNPPAGAWLSQIEAARSTAELVRMLRDYVVALSPEERAHLPAGCVAESIQSAADIQVLAVMLAQADLRTTGSATGATDALHQAAVVFAAAGSRLPKVAE